MRYRELAVLDRDDRELIDVLGMGMSRDVASVFAYLLQRTRQDAIQRAAATRLEIQVGTGLGRDATISATNELTEQSLVETTTVTHPDRDRRRKGWRAVAGLDSCVSTLFSAQASRLRTQGREIARRFGGATAVPDTPRTDPDPETPATVPDPDSLSVALNWEPNAVHFPLHAARQAGIYQEAGLSVSLHANRGSGEAIRTVVDGDHPLGIAGPITLLRAVMEAEAIVPLAVLYQRSMVVLYTLRSVFGTTFDSIDQLAGRRLAIAADSEPGRIATVVLSQQGLLDDVELVHVSGEEREALQAGTADVAVGVFTDPIALENEGRDADEVPIATGFPIPGPALVAHTDAIQSRESAIDRFLEATMHGWARGLREPGAVAADLESVAVGPTGAEVVDALITRFGTDATARKHGWGWQASDAWDRVAETLRVVEEAR